MKKLFISFLVLASYVCSAQKTEFVQTTQKFANGEYVWDVITDGKKVGEWWPVKKMQLVTKETLGADSNLMTQYPLDTLQKRFDAVAITPGSMTTNVSGTYQMEGRSLSLGVQCGDNYVYDYGVVILSREGYATNFTHIREKAMENFDSIYESYKVKGSTLFFLPSLFRNGKYISSTNTVDKVLVSRDTPSGEQIGVMLFDNPTTYNDVRAIVLGLDRTTSNGTMVSKTTHIYMLDGGPTWGQSLKKVNGKITMIGTRTPEFTTNYIVFK